MSTLTLLVPNISCHHCVRTISREVGALAGIRTVLVDVDTKTVNVEFESPATEEQIRALLVDIGYAPAEA